MGELGRMRRIETSWVDEGVRVNVVNLLPRCVSFCVKCAEGAGPWALGRVLRRLSPLRVNVDNSRSGENNPGL